MTTIRILLNTPNGALHGGPATHLPMLEAALRNSVDVHSYQYWRRSDSETLKRKVFDRLVDLVRFWKLCRKVRPDIVHHNSAFDRVSILRDAPLLIAAKLLRVPVFLKLHGSHSDALMPGFGIVSHVLRQVVIRNAARLGVLSSAEKREFEAAFPYVRGKVCVVKNIIASDFACVRRCEADKPTILFVSRFVRKKGPFDLLHAAPRVCREIPTAQFLFVGDGQDAPAFEDEVASMGLESTVQRASHVDKHGLLPLYAKAWMVVLPTYYPEGMPMVVAEAMAAGVPIISTPTRFGRSYLTENEHVLYHKPGDIEGIARAVLRLCRDEGLRRRMSNSNRELALRCFMEEEIVQEYLDLYRQMLAARSQA